MTTDILRLVPEGISHTDAHDAALASMTLDQRLTYHAKRVREIGFFEGINGVKQYKDKYPEAATIRHELRSIAGRPKPRGYKDYIVKMVDAWLQTKTAVLETNKADVERLNAHFETKRFNPNNHFSRPLPIRLREALRELFVQRGIPFIDVEKTDTLSKFREAARAAQGYEGPTRTFGAVGVISGETLVIGTQTFAIEMHHGLECVRVNVDGKRVRLRLAALEQVIDAIPEGRGSGADPLSDTTTISSIGELAPTPDQADFRAAGDVKAGELAPNPWRIGDLDRWLAANVTTVEQPHSTTDPDAVDPLTL